MKKPMSFLHNIPMTLFWQIIKRCRGDHEHQQIIGATPGHGSRAVQSQIYPVSFCRQLAQTLVDVQAQHTEPTPACVPAIDTDLMGSWEDYWEDLARTKDDKPVVDVTRTASAPAMPCVDPPQEQRHHEHTMPHPFVHYAMVARPVNKKESTTQPKAIAALKAEWTTMHAKVWNCWKVREKNDVLREARRRNVVVQFGRVHGIWVEKNSELPDGHPNKKYKGRVVFLGNRVSNQDFEAATFADLGNAPANPESGRLADCYGACPGHASENADGVQAYLQARMRGDPCWVELPPEAHPGSIWGPDNMSPEDLAKLIALWSQFICPVVIMTAALYGHPDSVSFWQDHCNERVGQVDFHGFGSEWPSVFYHKELRLLLTVYLDDFKLAGPEENLEKGWTFVATAD
jgi:hypothetical protein